MELETNLKSFSEEVETKIAEKLGKVGYNLDDTALFPSITGTTTVRMEQVFLILVHLILKEHKERIVKNLDSSDSKKISSLMLEWESLATTLATLLLAFHDRLEALMLSWRSLKLDVNVEVECYANGFYYAWHRDYVAPVSKVRPFLHQQRVSGKADEEAEEEEKTPIEILMKRIEKIETMLRQFTAPFSNTPGFNLLNRSNSTDGESSSPKIDPMEWRRQMQDAVKARSPFASPKQEQPPKDIPKPEPSRRTTETSDAPSSSPSSPPSSPPLEEGKKDKGGRFSSLKGLSGSLRR